jgi:hypothetical protein
MAADQDGYAAHESAAESDWRAIARGVTSEALEMYGRDDIELVALAARLRGHFLDRWYRFAPFGVTSRLDLEPITVEANVSSFERDGRTVVARVLGVNYTGTPLSGR